jgi:hypothetical protein
MQVRNIQVFTLKKLQNLRSSKVVVSKAPEVYNRG